MSSPFDADRKQKARAEDERVATEAAERLERAKRALPPNRLLERQALAQRKKDAQIRELEKEMNAELAQEKRVKAREVPISTYVVAVASSSCSSSSSSFGAVGVRSVSGVADESQVVVVTANELEAQRKERIRQRSLQLLESSELPPRMALAASSGAGQLSTSTRLGSNADASLLSAASAVRARVVSVKLKKQLAAEAEEQARKQRMKPKPVPDFDRLHGQWEALTKARKAAARLTSTAAAGGSETRPPPREFFTSRAATLAELAAKKAERRRKQLEQEERERAAQRDAQMKLLERTKATARGQGDASAGPDAAAAAPPSSTKGRPTKAEALRVKRVLERMMQSQRQQEQEAIEAEKRQQRRKLAAKRVAAQVRASEQARVGSRSDYVSLRDVEQLAQQRAQEFQRSLQASIKQNKARILGAVAAQPSLMERYATDLQREAHKKSALEAVVKNVFKSHLGAMKGVLTDDEHDLACDIVAADQSDKNDNDNDNDNDAGDGGTKAKAMNRTSKKKTTTQDEDEEEAAYSDA